MISRPIMHSRTADALDSLIQSKPQSVMFIGPVGSGKMYLANFFAQQILSSEGLDVKHHAQHIIHLQPNDKGTVSIDDIRQLYSDTKAVQDFSMLVIIENSQSMTSEAQNSFLKLLEEPPEKVIFVLTLDNPSHILPTIRSRTKIITVHKPNQTKSIEALEKIFTNIDKTILEQNLIKSNGRIGLTATRLNRPASDETDPLDTAKQLLSEPLSERMISIQPIMADRSQTLAILESLLTISAIAAKSTAHQNQADKLADWLDRQQLCQTALRRLQKGANHKIQLLNVAIHL